MTKFQSAIGIIFILHLSSLILAFGAVTTYPRRKAPLWREAELLGRVAKDADPNKLNGWLKHIGHSR